ncbi:MAG TPA: flagellar basal body-associated protein FliL [Xanthobacteraceae bacterium]|nr:flagellar basal body-associated protein FliL [Xanthobacteraceae bacterium]
MAKKKKEAQSESEADAEIENQEAEGEEGKEPSAKRKFPSFKLPSRKVLMMGGGGLAALIAIGGGGYYFFLSGNGKAHAAAAPAANVIKPVVFLDMPDVLVNLAGTAGDHTQYLKVKVTLELPDHAMEAQITPVMPRLMDTFQTYLRELRPTDLDGSAGLYRLKEELTRRVNAAIAPSKVNAVLFKEIVVQ